MPRRSSRVTAEPAAALAREPAAPKRPTSTPLDTTASETKTKRRRFSQGTASQRPIRSTAKKSKYFEKPDPDDSESDSAYEEADGDNGTTISDSDPAESEEDEEEKKPKKRRRGRPAKTEKTRYRVTSDEDEDNPELKTIKGKELWREGVRTGLGPGKEVFIKKPKARDPGDIPYQDHTIHPNTMLFLKDLKENNERQWLKAHDADYRNSKKDWDSFVESLTEKIIEKDETIPELPAKDLVFRIHRDIRFSNDPTPYKTHFSAAWSRTGKKGPYAAYYVHLQPGSCFVGSGLWMPEASKLALLREDIDRNSQRLKAILRSAGMRREIFNGIPDDESEAVKAFVNQNRESALKTKPKGYEQDNPNIELLRLRSFTVGKPLSDEDLLSPNAQEKIVDLIGVMVPFVTYLNGVVMPDPVDDEPSGDDGSVDED
ncbi:hypothetical protein VTN77DRAFT_5498 [Rasamsonia byssochlamydoides]|uniref:uncharacterized protein n=1 Tax=Rasamsonia byssochlamydoides TaxID=89139 RepID=UPI003742A51C